MARNFNKLLFADQILKIVERFDERLHAGEQMATVEELTRRCESPSVKSNLESFAKAVNEVIASAEMKGIRK